MTRLLYIVAVMIITMLCDGYHCMSAHVVLTSRADSNVTINSCDSNCLTINNLITRIRDVYPYYDTRGNWSDIQPGLVSMLLDSVVHDTQDTKLKDSVLCDFQYPLEADGNIFGGAMPQFLNIKNKELKRLNVDSLKYNWKDDVIYCLNFTYKGQGHSNDYLKGSITWSPTDTIYIDSDVQRLIDGKHEVDQKLIRRSIKNLSSGDSVMLKLIDNWDENVLRSNSEKTWRFIKKDVKLKKFNLIYNKLLRIKITDGRITQSSTLYLYPLENQIDWMLNYDTFRRLPLVE